MSDGDGGSGPDQGKGRLLVKLAHDPSEVADVQRLRYRVFAQEMGAQVYAPDGLEQDRFDPFCHHLYVRDEDTGAIASSTRILTRSAAQRAGGFYSAGEFDLGRIASLSGRMIEIGRTCVHADYRSGAAIGMLWAGLAQFIEINGVDYLIGCASIPVEDGGSQATAIMEALRERHMSPAHLRVTPRNPLPPAKVELLTRPVLPPLLKAYLRLGAWVCGEPCWDPDFRVADVLILLDVDNLQTRYVRHFLHRGVDPHRQAYAIAS